MTSEPPTPDYRTLGVVVARWRRERGWSVERLSQEAQVAHRSVTNVEGGHHVPRLETIWRLAHAFGVPVGDLANTLHGEGEALDEGRNPER